MTPLRPDVAAMIAEIEALGPEDQARALEYLDRVIAESKSERDTPPNG